MPDLYFYRDPEEIENEEQAVAEIPRRNFRVTGLLHLLSSLLLSLQIPLGLLSSFLLKTGALSLPQKPGLQLDCSGHQMVEMNFHRVGQAGLELLTSGDPPTLAFQSPGITGMSHCTWPNTCFSLFMFIYFCHMFFI
ncbi:hypothetical protein AAY473_016649, partial [Plecturocebus cupreus]